MDLWLAYKNLGIDLMPNAQVVADRFHVMAQINKELDQERKREKQQRKKSLEKAKSDQAKTKHQKVLEVLTKSKYALLKNENYLNKEQKKQLSEVKKISVNLKKMHELKEKIRKIFEKTSNWYTGLVKLGIWLSRAKKYFPESQKTINRWLDEIIAYFDHRTTSGVVEGINNKLKLIKRSAYGFRNFENFRFEMFIKLAF